MTVLARIYEKVLKNTFYISNIWKNLKKPKNYDTDKNCLTWGNLWTTFQLAQLFALMVSRPELTNGLRYWLGIWFRSSIWNAGGLHALLPTRDCSQITSFQKNAKNTEYGQFFVQMII